MEKITIKTYCYLTLLFFFGLNQNKALAQGIVPGYPQTDGRVENLISKNDTVFMSGAFTSVYYADSIASYGTIINKNSGKPATLWDQPNGVVHASTPDGNGGFFIGGDFSRVGGQNAGRIAHLNNQGQLTNVLLNNNVNGVVKAMATLGDTVFVGGQFSLVGDFFETAGAPVLRHTNMVSKNFPSINGNVDCAIPDGLGGWYVTGNFTSVGGVLRNRAARIDSNGNLLAWNPNINGVTLTMTIFQDKVYLGGSFSNVGALVRSGIASVDTASGAVSTWNPGTPSMVIRSFSKIGNLLYVAGVFTSIAAISRANIASFNLPSGTLTSFNTSMASSGASLFSVVAVGNKVFVGGSFNIIGGITRNNLACLDATTFNTVSTWNANTDNRVTKILYHNGQIYVGGQFNVIRGIAKTFLAAADTSTGVIHPFSPSLTGEVVAMEIGSSDSTLYISGDFTNWYYSYNLKDHSGSPWPLKATYYANTLSLVGSRLFVGGSFNGLGGVDRTNLAAFSKSTGAILNWNPKANSRVEAICNVKDSFIFVAGYFSQIGSSNRENLASFNRAGNLTNFSFGFSFMSYVNALAFSGDSILYVGGNFSSVSTASPFFSASTFAGKIAALNFRTGRFQPTWNPNANKEVNTLLVDSNIVYVGGIFSYIGGQNRNSLGAVLRSNAMATNFNALLPAASIINALAKDMNNLIVGGNFYYAPSTSIIRKNLASFNVTNNTLNNFISEPDLPVNCLAKFGNQIYCGGDFTVLGALRRNNIAAFLASSGKILDFDLGLSNTTGNMIVTAIEWVDDYLFVGGNFTKIGDSSRTNFGVIHIPTQTVLAFKPQPNGTIYSIYYHQNYLYISGQFTSIAGNTRNRLAIFDYPSLTINAINPNFSGWALSYAVINTSKLILGGIFTTIGGISAPSCAAFSLPSFNRITPTPLYFNPLGASSVSQVNLIKNRLMIAGGFTEIGGLPRPYFAILDSATLLPTNFISNISGGGVYKFGISEADNAYMGGNFTTLGGATRSICGSISTLTGLANNWYPQIQNINSIKAPQLSKIMVFGNKVILGGTFNRINGMPMRSLAVLYGADTAATISSLSSSGAVCQGANLTINYTVSKTFGSSNQFIVELVDTGFPFKPAIQIGTISASIGGAIATTIPWTIPINKGYYVQIRSTNPVSISKSAASLISPINCIPTIGPSNLLFTNLTNQSASLGWTRGNGQKCLVIARFGATVNVLPSNGLSYTANSNFAQGDSIGNGNFVVFNGTGNSLTVNNLNMASNYHFAVIEYNGNMASSAYLNAQALYGNATTLPVKWLKFNAEKSGSTQATLYWSTASETNNDHFIIERKNKEEMDWENIGKMQGNGNTSVQTNYLFIDNFSKEVLQETLLYYRLKQVDFDGKFEYSKVAILPLKNKEENALLIKPNPFHQELSISFGLYQILSYKIYTLNGELVLSKLNQLPEIKLNTSDWIPGLYLIELTTPEGIFRSKIAKNNM
ncbi:MAG: T9SS type A sorting domain-containing protein [bacterium]|nr:T9SS type A sorting domain-containing protein [bacterium]